LPYIEAVRQLLWEFGENNGIANSFNPWLPYLFSCGRNKGTKPTQHSALDLKESGIKADFGL